MELTQSDYEDRVARIAAGAGDDEDRRLVKLYEREGFTVEPERLSDFVIDEADEADEVADSYDTLDYRAVQSLARERSIDATGKQAEIVARLRAADQANPDPSAGG